MNLVKFLQAPAIFPGIRHAAKVDYYEMAAIDRACFANPWSVDDLDRVLKGRYCIGVVAEDRGLVRGYLAFELLPTKIELVRLAVHPDHRGQGVGCRLIDRIKAKLTPECRIRINVHVRESNLAAQLFLRGRGFLAKKIERGHFRDTREDAYVMTYDLDDQP